MEITPLHHKLHERGSSALRTSRSFNDLTLIYKKEVSYEQITSNIISCGGARAAISHSEPRRSLSRPEWLITRSSWEALLPWLAASWDLLLSGQAIRGVEAPLSCKTTLSLGIVRSLWRSHSCVTGDSLDTGIGLSGKTSRLSLTGLQIPWLPFEFSTSSPCCPGIYFEPAAAWPNACSLDTLWFAWEGWAITNSRFGPRSCPTYQILWASSNCLSPLFGTNTSTGKGGIVLGQTE